VLDSRYPFCIYANTGSPCPPSWQFDQQYEIHTPLDANVSICRQGERSLRAGDAWLEYTVGVEVENPNYALRVAETAFYLSCIPNAGVRSVVRSALRYGARNLLQPAGQTIWRACVGQDIMSARNLSVASGLAGAAVCVKDFETTS